jgi:hypothetical protein
MKNQQPFMLICINLIDKMKSYLLLILLFHFTVSLNTIHAQNWLVSDLLEKDSGEIQVKGYPQTKSEGCREAVFFDGERDGIFLDSMPLEGLRQFTIEVIFKPERGGNFEQRFFHCGEIRGDRVLLELRANEDEWYFDAFIKAGDQSIAMIEPTFTHPLDQWHRVAFVVDEGDLSTYVNGKKELEAKIDLTPIQIGKTSLGVRLNERSWFKGAIEQVRITPKALNVKEFLQLNNPINH